MAQRQHQRFSWQAPVEDEAPAYDQHASYHAPQQAQQPQPRTDAAPQQPRVFSYAQTPLEYRTPHFTSSPNDPPLPQPAQIAQSPVYSPYTPINTQHQSAFNPHLQTIQYQQVAYPQIAPSLDQKHPISPVSQHSSPQPHSFSPVSPVSAIRAQSIPKDESRHARQLSSLSPINTNVRPQPPPPMPIHLSQPDQTSPLPYKAPLSPIVATPIKPDHDPRNATTSPSQARTSYAAEPYSPHGFSSKQTTNLHAIFSPDAAHGPNGLDSSLHQPGQIAHPNMDMSSTGDTHAWKNSLCACSGDLSTCLTGLFCPCILYGRTSYRLSQKSAKKDPTDMLGYSATNTNCLLMSAACGLWCVFPMLQRMRVRRAYKLEGGAFGDLLKGCCCCWCAAVANEREVRGREEAVRRWAGPASGDVYGRSGGMVYKPQQ